MNNANNIEEIQDIMNNLTNELNLQQAKEMALKELNEYKINLLI